MTEKARHGASRWREMAVVCGVMLLATALRLIDLGGESLWYDEAYSVWAASMPELGSVRLLWDWQVVFPLYYLILNNWIDAFGAGVLSVRMLSVVAGVAAIVPMYAWTKLLYGKRAGLLAALLLALNPWHIWYSQEARMYSLAILVTLGALYCFAQIIRGGRWPWWLAYVACMGLTFHLHYYVGWVMASHNLHYGVRLVRGGALRSWRAFWRQAKSWLFAQMAIVLIALPSLAIFWEQFSHSHWDWLSQRYAAPGLGELADMFAAYALGTTYAGPSLVRWACVAVSGLVVLAAGAFALQRRQGECLASLAEASIVLAVPLIAVFVMGQFASVWVPRYLVLFLPAWLALVARGVEALPWRVVGGLCIALIVAATSLSLAGMYSAQQKEDWRGVVAHLDSVATERDLLVLMDEECRVPFDYYGADLFPERRIEVGRFSDDETLDASVDSVVQRAEDGRVWVLISHADGSGLSDRLDAASTLVRSDAPVFVGIDMMIYDVR